MAEEYDNTNSGAAFPPFPTQQMILQGKVDIESTESKIVCVRDQTRDGRNIVEVYAKIAVLFENDKKGNEAAPDFSGPLDHHDNLKIAGWRKKAKDSDKHFMSFKVSEKQKSSLPNDEIPF